MAICLDLLTTLVGSRKLVIMLTALLVAASQSDFLCEVGRLAPPLYKSIITQSCSTPCHKVLETLSLTSATARTQTPIGHFSVR